MAKNNYASEVGIDSGEKRLSWPATLIILAVLAAAGWFAFAKARTAAPERPPAQPVATPESAATH